jgi:hypothetical protein
MACLRWMVAAILFYTDSVFPRMDRIFTSGICVFGSGLSLVDILIPCDAFSLVLA